MLSPRILWFVLAGFILGFAASSLWEWYYYRGKRLASGNRRLYELENELIEKDEAIARLKLNAGAAQDGGKATLAAVPEDWGRATEIGPAAMPVVESPGLHPANDDESESISFSPGSSFTTVQQPASSMDQRVPSGFSPISAMHAQHEAAETVLSPDTGSADYLRDDEPRDESSPVEELISFRRGPARRSGSRNRLSDPSQPLADSPSTELPSANLHNRSDDRSTQTGVPPDRVSPSAGSNVRNPDSLDRDLRDPDLTNESTAQEFPPTSTLSRRPIADDSALDSSLVSSFGDGTSSQQEPSKGSSTQETSRQKPADETSAELRVRSPHPQLERGTLQRRPLRDIEPQAEAAAPNPTPANIGRSAETQIAENVEAISPSAASVASSAAISSAATSTSSQVDDDDSSGIYFDYPDDLTKIKGIGRVFRKRLYEEGISTWHELTQTNNARLGQITRARTNDKIDSWKRQARDLAKANDRVGATYDGPTPDNLEEIAGVTPTVMHMLFQLGIVSFRELGKRRPAELRRVFEDVPGVAPDDILAWIHQAQAIDYKTNV